MDAHPASSSELPAAHGLCERLPLPVCLVDSGSRVLAMNRSARSFWQVEPECVLGQPAMQALGIVPADGGGNAFLRAPAEELPVASATADLAIGALFLQFTNPVDALREVARVVRPGWAGRHQRRPHVSLAAGVAGDPCTRAG